MTSKTTLIGISGKMRHGKDATCELFIKAAQALGYPHPVIRRAFADALKEECATFMQSLTDIYNKHGLVLTADTTEEHEAVAEILGACLYTGGINICQTEGSELLLDWYLNDLSAYIEQYGMRPLSLAHLIPDNQGWINTFNDATVKPLFRKMLQWYGTEYRRTLFGNTYWLDKMEDFLAAQEPGTLVIAPDTRFINEAEFCRHHNGFLIRVWRPGVEAVSNHPSETMLDDYQHFNIVIENKSDLPTLEQAVFHTFKLFQQWQGGPVLPYLDPLATVMFYGDWPI